MHILARNREQHLVLLGGLGVMGVGRMWSPESDTLARLPVGEESHGGLNMTLRPDLTYDTAPDLEVPEDW